MARYERYTTTVVGSHSVPRWYEALEKLVESGVLSTADLRDAHYRATQAALLDQEVAGHRHRHRRRDAPTDEQPARAGQRHVRTSSGAGSRPSARPKPITDQDPGVLHPAAICRDRIGDAADLGLVDQYLIVRRYARHEVKVTMTGPHMLAKAAHDEHYGDLALMMEEPGQAPAAELPAPGGRVPASPDRRAAVRRR